LTPNARLQAHAARGSSPCKPWFAVACVFQMLYQETLQAGKTGHSEAA
jgi:hypothetical protein